MRVEKVVRMCLSASAAVILVAAPLAQAQQECEQIRRSCLDYCRYGPVTPESGRDCKKECQKKVKTAARGCVARMAVQPTAARAMALLAMRLPPLAMARPPTVLQARRFAATAPPDTGPRAMAPLPSLRPRARPRLLPRRPR